MGSGIGMGKKSGGIIFLLIVCVHPATSQRPDDKAKAEEAPPCPPSPPQVPYSSLNTCHNHLITELVEASTCTPPPHPPHDDDGDLNPESDRKVILIDGAVVLALLIKPRNEKGTAWEIVLTFLMFPLAMYVLLFCDILLRNMYPRFVEVFEKLLAILFVNGVMAFLLPAECFWVPLLCFSSSLLALIMPAFLP